MLPFNAANMNWSLDCADSDGKAFGHLNQDPKEIDSKTGFLMWEPY